jgi:hypothetical protein
MANDDELDFGVHQPVGRASSPPDHQAQQQIQEGKEQGLNLPREEGRCCECAGEAPIRGLCALQAQPRCYLVLAAGEVS